MKEKIGEAPSDTVSDKHEFTILDVAIRKYDVSTPPEP